MTDKSTYIIISIMRIYIGASPIRIIIPMKKLIIISKSVRNIQLYDAGALHFPEGRFQTFFNIASPTPIRKMPTKIGINIGANQHKIPPAIQAKIIVASLPLDSPAYCVVFPLVRLGAPNKYFLGLPLLTPRFKEPISRYLFVSPCLSAILAIKITYLVFNKEKRIFYLTTL